MSLADRVRALDLGKRPHRENHDRLVVMGGVMTPERIDEARMADEPVFIDVTAEMHEIVDQIHRRPGRNQQPADIGQNQPMPILVIYHGKRFIRTSVRFSHELC